MSTTDEKPPLTRERIIQVLEGYSMNWRQSFPEGSMLRVRPSDDQPGSYSVMLLSTAPGHERFDVDEDSWA